MRLINDKPISEVLRLLREPKDPDKKLMGKYPYYKIDSFYERVNSCVGTDHYTVEYSDRELHTIASGQEVMLCKCRITILDDDFQPVLFKESYGGREIHYGEQSHIDDGIKNLASNAAIAAFKEAWKSFGIFGIRPDDNSEDGKNSTSSTQAGNNENTADDTQQTQNDYETYQLAGTESVVIERTDTRTNMPVYKYRCKGIGTQTEYDVIFYPNRYKKIEDKMKKMIATASNGPMQLSIKAKKLDQRNGVLQLIFDQFVA